MMETLIAIAVAASNSNRFSLIDAPYVTDMLYTVNLTDLV